MTKYNLTLDEALQLEYQFMGKKHDFAGVTAGLGQGSLEDEKKLRVLNAHLNNPKSKLSIVKPRLSKENEAIQETIQQIQHEDYTSALIGEQALLRQEKSEKKAAENNETFYEEKEFSLSTASHILEMSNWLQSKKFVFEAFSSQVTGKTAFKVYKVSESDLEKINKKYKSILLAEKVTAGGKVAAEVTGTVTKGAVAVTGKVLSAAVNVTTSTVVQTGKSIVELAAVGTANAVDEYKHQAARLAVDSEVQRAGVMVKSGYNSILNKFKKKSGGSGGLDFN